MKMKSIFVLVSLMIGALALLSSCKKVDKSYAHFQPQAGLYHGNAVAYLQDQPGLYDSLLLMLDRVPRLKDSLENEKVTLFAVSNRSLSLALQNINQARRDSVPGMEPVNLSVIDSTVIDTFLCRYILQNNIPTSEIVDFADGLFFPTIQYVNDNGADTTYRMQMQFEHTNASGFLGGGPAVIIFSDPKGSIFTMYWVRVNTITVDIRTDNAIVHLLPPGHDFGFGDEFIRAVNFR